MLHYEANNAEISVDLRPADEPGFAAVVRLRGEHDLATGDELRAVLALIDGNVLVDLSACEFIDSTVISVLISSDHERAKEGQRLELRVLEGGQIARTIEVSGVGQLLIVHHAG